MERFQKDFNKKSNGIWPAAKIIKNLKFFNGILISLIESSQLPKSLKMEGFQ